MSDEPRNTDAPLFPFGEGTLMQLREQPWEFEELGTRVIAPQRAAMTIATEEPPPQAAALPVAEGDPLVRIERKLDELTRAMQTLQRRFDSIDATIARALAK